MRILLVDDHVLFSKGLEFLLADLDPLAQCVTADTIAKAVATPGPFDLVLLDYSLPDSDGERGLERVLRAFDGVPVVMLSGETNPALIRELVDFGAWGFISKGADTPELLEALRTILAGGVYLPPQERDSNADAGESLPLTPRQTEILLMLMQGKSNKAIANALSLGENTVKTHLAAAFRILEVNNRTEAVFKAAALGLKPVGMVKSPFRL